MKSKLKFWQLALAWVAAVAASGTNSNAVELATDPLLDWPQLSLAYSNGGVVITWPAAAGGWVLEQAPSLSSPIPWTVVPLDLAQTNGTNVTLTAPALEEITFYRLRKLAVPGLVGDWSFDEGTGQVAFDGSGFDNGLVLTNVAWGTGRVGSGALWFNGGAAASSTRSQAWANNDNFRLLPDSGQPFSVSLWFNPDAFTNGWRGLIGNDAGGTSGWHLALHHPGPGTNELVFASVGSGTLNIVALPRMPGLLPGQWHEVTATFDGSEGAVYLDGQFLARSSGTITANSDALYVGGGVGGYDSFLGLIDEVRIYTNALAAEDVSLTGAWNMDENRGTFLADSSGHRRHASLSNDGAWTNGKHGSAVNLSNNTVVIRNDSADVLPLTGGSFSLSFWIYPSDLADGSSGLMSCTDGTNTGWQLALNQTNGQTQLRFWSTDSGGTLDVSAPVSLTGQAWSKLDVTFNGGIANLYLNGLKVKSGNGGIQGNRVPLLLGAVTGMANFNGAIDELRIYRRERQEEEIGPVAKVMWETVLMNTSSNLVLQGFGPPGKTLTFSIVDTISPTNGTIVHDSASPTVTYVAGPSKGPDAFTYTVSDGEFTTPPTIVAISVVAPHWLSPSGGNTPPLDGSSPEHAWVASPAEALDAIWRTNSYYDCFFYGLGEYETTGWHYSERITAFPGCKHVGSGSEGQSRTTLKLVNTWQPWNEGEIFGSSWIMANGFEARNMVLDCNSTNNPQYTIGEPVWVMVPLTATSHVDKITLRWNQGAIPCNGFLPSGRSYWGLGPAQDFNVCTRTTAAGNYVTNCSSLHSTGNVDVVAVGADTDQILVQMTHRADGIDFYSLRELEVSGGSVSLATATATNGSRSQLNTNTAAYSIVNAFDNNDTSAWASGPETQVDIMIPLEPNTTVSELDLSWNCQTIANVGRLGPASEYQIKARDTITGIYTDVAFTQLPRFTNGVQTNLFSSTVTTDRILVQFKTRELGVDFYSLREIRLQNGFAQIQPRLPTTLNPFSRASYYLSSMLCAFDGDLSTTWTCGQQGMIGAAYVNGENLKFSHLKVIGFSNRALRECFVMFVQAPHGNVLMEDCTFSDPAPDNGDTCTVVRLNAPGENITNAVVRHCTVGPLRAFFPTSNGFSAVHVEDTLVTNCTIALYFEPETGPGESVGSVLLQRNRFVDVVRGCYLGFHAGTHFDSISMLDNEIVLSPYSSSGISACDVCDQGPSGVSTNVTVLNNIIRYADWAPQPLNNGDGLYYWNIQHAVFGNNVIALGSANALRLRPCPAGYIPPVIQKETCDAPQIVLAPASSPPCLDLLPPGYDRAWFNNHDLQGNLLKVKYQDSTNPGSTGFAFQQQWP